LESEGQTVRFKYYNLSVKQNRGKNTRKRTLRIAITKILMYISTLSVLWFQGNLHPNFRHFESKFCNSFTKVGDGYEVSSNLLGHILLFWKVTMQTFQKSLLINLKSSIVKKMEFLCTLSQKNANISAKGLRILDLRAVWETSFYKKLLNT
jgi:hypothetical protein